MVLESPFHWLGKVGEIDFFYGCSSVLPRSTSRCTRTILQGLRFEMQMLGIGKRIGGYK